MKKVFALGVAGLLMMGAASQAHAEFEDGNLILVAYDREAQKEQAWDLGSIATLLGTTTTTWNIDVDDTWAFNDSKSGVAVYAETTTLLPSGARKNSGFFAITSNNIEDVALGTSASSWKTAVGRVRGAYQADSDNILATNTSSSFNATFNTSTSSGKYAGIRTKFNLEAEYPAAEDEVTTMYLWAFDSDNVNNKMYVANMGQSAATITIDNDGLVTFTSTPAVPVPGAALMFGSALLGLAGIRRRQNS